MDLPIPIAIELAAFRALLAAPPALRRLLAGPPPVADGVALDEDHHWLCWIVDRFDRFGESSARTRARSRRKQERAAGVLGGPLPDGVAIGPRVLHLDGRDLGARVYTPASPTGAGLVYLHGGGFVYGSSLSHDRVTARLAAQTGAVVVSVDYRLAPEHPFPAAVDDAADAFAWAVGQSESLGVDPTRWAIGGDSAGACLSAVTVNARVASGLPTPAHQLLIYPVTDMSKAHPSRDRFTKGLFLDAEAIDWFTGQYLSDPSERFDPRVSPLLAGSLSGACPATVVTAGFDPLVDEGLAYADRLEAEGVPVTRVHAPDLIHGFVNFAGVFPAAAAWLRRLDLG